MTVAEVTSLEGGKASHDLYITNINKVEYSLFGLNLEIGIYKTVLITRIRINCLNCLFTGLKKKP